MSVNSGKSYKTYRVFADSGARSGTAGNTFAQPPEALWFEQHSSNRSSGIEYRDKDGNLRKVCTIHGAGAAGGLLEIGDCVQVTRLLNRMHTGGEGNAHADSRCYGLY